MPQGIKRLRFSRSIPNHTSKTRSNLKLSSAKTEIRKNCPRLLRFWKNIFTALVKRLSFAKKVYTRGFGCFVIFFYDMPIRRERRDVIHGMPPESFPIDTARAGSKQ